jgi:hypothetical protein
MSRKIFPFDKTAPAASPPVSPASGVQVISFSGPRARNSASPIKTADSTGSVAERGNQEDDRGVNSEIREGKKQTMKWKLVLAIVALAVVVYAVLGVAEMGSTRDNLCQLKIPKWFGCVIAKHESLAGGLIGAIGTILAALIAWTAVERQIANEKMLQTRREEETYQVIQAHGFALERAVFLTVLHRLFAGGSDRAADRWREDYRIDGVEGLELHRLYRAMAWLGEELPAAEQDGCVIREAIRKKGMVPIGRVVLSTREHIIALEARDRGILIDVLRADPGSGRERRLQPAIA